MFYFTADIHFADPKTLKVEKRPFKNIRQYDRYIIRHFNKQAKKDDVIFFIGDFFDYDGKENEQCFFKACNYVKKIKAKKILIVGNNEERIINRFFEGDFDKFARHCKNLGFADVKKSLYLDFSNRHFFLTHQPKDYDPNAFNLFGHTHRNGGLYKSFGMNVGVDLNYFRLWSEKDIIYFIENNKTWIDKDVNLFVD